MLVLIKYRISKCGNPMWILQHMLIASKKQLE